MNRRFRELRKLLTARLGKMVGTITYVATTDNVAALTFDDGPHPEYTPGLLEILAKHQAQATFFMVGQAAQRHPDVVQQVAQAGHAIGNHTWDHTSLVSIGQRERRRQIQACAEAIAPYDQRLFRPPYGHQSPVAHFDVVRSGYKVVTWSLHANDWMDQPGATMAEHLIKNIQPGSIVLLHDAVCRPDGPANPDRRQMLIAVELLLTRLSQQMRFVTIPELLQRGQPQRENWYRKDEDNDSR